MEILVVKGKGNCGKTTTLKMLIQMLCQDPRFRLYEKSLNFDANMAIPTRDLWAKFCYGGVHILVCTYGDSAKEVADLINKRGADCDIAVCACHPNYQEAFQVLNRPIIHEIEKTASSEKDNIAADNEQFANDLFEKLVALAEEKRKELQKTFKNFP